jgi:hypothetical protein
MTWTQKKKAVTNLSLQNLNGQHEFKQHKIRQDETGPRNIVSLVYYNPSSLEVQKSGLGMR